MGMLQKLFGGLFAVDDRQAIKGAWVAVTAEVDGRPREDLEGEKLVFEDDGVSIGRRFPMATGAYRLDPAASPRRLTLDRLNAQMTPAYLTVAVETDTSNPMFSSGRAMVRTYHHAIYELAGDTLKVCGMGQDYEWPQDFATRPDSGQCCIVYRRETA